MLRVDSVADAHLALQQSPDLRVIAADRMIADLCARLAVLDPAVTIRTERLAPVELHAEQAIPLGLALSEILTNALRHAFPPGAGGVIGVRATAVASVLEIVVQDGGRGLPAEPTPQTGLGSIIVRALAAQLDAEVTTASAPGAGTTVTLRLPLAQCRPAARASVAA
ncbi:MAG TPA: sensor histidine kinase [Acetobacteraceae bacterium]|nr:sensor histidine kinase [Acetobacteraceae bacterium]